MIRALAAAFLAAALGLAASGPAVAANCDTFTDVQTTDSYCPAVQWLKNRQITLGCTSTTLYCPADTVTRASMALFMNRLGVALTPQFVSGQSGIVPAAVAPGQFLAFCPFPGPAAVAFPRISRAAGSVGITASGPALDMFLVVAINGNPYQNMNSASLRITSPSGQQTLTWHSANVAVPANATTQFAIGISNPAGSGATLNLGAGTCAIQVEVANTNPASPPFDE
jgi:hypothetical protein